MKRLKIIACALGFATLALTQTALAQPQTNLFPLVFRAVCSSTNASGILHELVLNQNLIGDCAADHGVTNLAGLHLVYNRTNNTIQVIGTNGVALCTSFTFSGGLVFTNTNNTSIVFQRDVFVGGNLVPTGVISGSAAWNSTNLASFGLNAQLLYIEPAVGTNGPAICRAKLRVGTAIQQDQDEDNDEDNDEDGHHGDNGNHNGWHNPHNPHSHP